MSVPGSSRQNERGEWVPLEPLPEPFGVLWGRMMARRREDGASRAGALVRGWFDARAITKAARP